METDDVRQQLEAAERGAAAPWRHDDRRGAGTAVGIGLAAGAGVLAAALLPAPWWFLGYAAAVAALLGLWFRYWSARGAFPRGRMPRELTASMYAVLFGGAAVGLGAWALAVLVSPWVAAAAAAVAAGALFWGFDRSYARASATLGDRATAGGAA